MGELLEPYIRHWALIPDDDPIVTRSSHLLPVLHRGEPAMLKVAVAEEEKGGGALMAWWDGCGAARVLALDGAAVLLERATGSQSLIEMARSGQDNQSQCGDLQGDCTPAHGTAMSAASAGASHGMVQAADGGRSPS